MNDLESTQNLWKVEMISVDKLSYPVQCNGKTRYSAILKCTQHICHHLLQPESEGCTNFQFSKNKEVISAHVLLNFYKCSSKLSSLGISRHKNVKDINFVDVPLGFTRDL